MKTAPTHKDPSHFKSNHTASLEPVASSAIPAPSSLLKKNINRYLNKAEDRLAVLFVFCLLLLLSLLERMKLLEEVPGMN